MAMIHLEPQTAQMFSRALGALKPPPNLTLSQWADNYRRLSAEASAAQGRWNTDNAPFQREIMDAIGDVHIRKVVAMMCAQSGKTDGLILNTIGYYMSYYPAPIMIVQPTVNLGESFSKDRLATMIRDTPVLRGLVDNKSRYSGNTIMKKNFAGGQLTIVGANAPTDLRGRPIKVLLADEVDAYKASAGKEGDPVMLAEQRQTTYWDYKTVLVSTPTDKNNSRILDEFNASTQEEWTVPCPNCGFYQPFVWDNMVFDKDKWPEGGVQYRCAECGCLDNEYRWKKNSLKGKWHAEHPERAVRGFHMNKIGSTLCGWDKIVEDFIAADLDAQRGDYEKMQVFVNTDLGLPWEEPGEAVEANNLLDRREFYEAEVPDGVVYLTAGVDTQDSRGHRIRDSHASQTGKGTDDGLMRLKTHMVDYYRREGHGADGWVLKGDVRHFFASIDHRKLKRKLKAVLDKRGVDPRVYELLCIYIDVMEDGLPLGYQTSQLFALMFLDEFDHIIKEKYRIKYYGRYMDDFYIICSDKKKLQCILRDVRALMDSYGLELNQKTAIFPLRNGIDFLGFHRYLTDTGAVIQKLRRDSSKRMKNKIKYWETAYPAGEATKQEILRSFDAWDAHAAHGDTYSLRRQYADRLEKLLECKIPIHRKINSNKLARDRRRARQCRCIYKKQHKALSLSVSQNTRPAEIMPWA